MARGVKMQNLELKTPILGKLGKKFKFAAVCRNSRGNLHLLLKKIATSCPAIFLPMTPLIIS